MSPLILMGTSVPFVPIRLQSVQIGDAIIPKRYNLLSSLSIISLNNKGMTFFISFLYLQIQFTFLFLVIPSEMLYVILGTRETLAPEG